MLRPDNQEKDHFFERLQITVNYDREEVYIYGLHLILFDDRCGFVRRYQSVIWDNTMPKC